MIYLSAETFFVCCFGIAASFEGNSSVATLISS